MPTTISKAPASIQPLASRVESKRESKNITHDIIGRTDVDVTFGGASLRTGTVEMLFSNHTAARAAEAFLAVPGVFTLADSELPGLNMRFVVSGAIEVAVWETITHWTVKFDFTEVV